MSSPLELANVREVEVPRGRRDAEGETAMIQLDLLDFAKGEGVVTVVAVDDLSGRVLMVAQADRRALELTLRTGDMHYLSRTRGLWRKGTTSGNVQRVVVLTPDCDGDVVLARVRPAGPACHTGATSCFADAGSALARLDATIAGRASAVAPPSPSAMTSPTALVPERPSYTRRLLDDQNLRLKKIGEEAAELVLAAAVADPQRAVEEAADLIYHTLVALRALGVGLDEVSATLAGRSARARGG